MRRIERGLVVLSFAFGLAYPLLATFPFDPTTAIALKGAGVGLLALAAALQARTADGGLLAALLALGATGDVLLEIHFGAGAAAFAAAHLVAILLYWRNRQGFLPPWAWGAASAFPILSAASAFLLVGDRPEGPAFAGYALLLGAMTTAAWLSRFPRALVGLGALLFLTSDMLIAFRLGSGAAGFHLNAGIWLLYYAGQAMIFLGVSTSLPPRERSSGRGGPAKLVEG